MKLPEVFNFLKLLTRVVGWFDCFDGVYVHTRSDGVSGSIMEDTQTAEAGCTAALGTQKRSLATGPTGLGTARREKHGLGICTNKHASAQISM